MTLCLTVPDDTDGLVHQLLPLGSGQPITTHVANIDSLANLAPLTRELYVDGGTAVPAAERDGSIARPFGTIQDGVDALALTSGGVLLIAPGAYGESVLGGGVGVPIDFVNLGANAGGVVSTQSIAIKGGAVSLIAVTVLGNITSTTTAQLRMDRSICIGTVTCSGLTMLSGSSISNTVTCTTFTGTDSTCNGSVNATGVMLLRDVTVLAALTTTVAGGTTRLDNVRVGTTYTANGAGTTTVARQCQIGLAFNATILDMAFCTVGDAVNTTGAATISFARIAGTFSCGAGATLYQARLSNVSAITGALFTDFESIAGVLPVLSYGSIAIQQTAPRITLSVAVPAVAAGAVNYVNVSLVGTNIEGMLTADSLIIANPVVDLIVAGAGGGFINVRFNAANSLRFAFVGPLLVGARDFIVGLV